MLALKIFGGGSLYNEGDRSDIIIMCATLFKYDIITSIEKKIIKLGHFLYVQGHNNIEGKNMRLITRVPFHEIFIQKCLVYFL